MKLKNTLFMMLIAVIGILGFNTVNAATISENGEYSLVLTIDGLEEAVIADGEYAKLIRFNVDNGETTVKVSELTKGITPFNGKNEFSHWVNSSKEKVDELNITDFTSNGNFYTSTGKEISYSNGFRLIAKFEGKSLEEGDNYYITIDAFGGEVNGKAKLSLTSSKESFKTIDLENYTPVRKGYAFKGWDLNGKFVTSIDSSAFSKSVIITVTATYTKNTFDGTDRVLILDANGGSIDGKSLKKYDYLGGGGSGTAMSLLPYVPTRDGYTFNGWNSKKDGSGKEYSYIYWRRWDKDDKDDLQRDTTINNSLGAEYYQNVTLYATWTKNPTEEETVKEIQSTGETKGQIEFDSGVNKNYKLDIKPTEIKKELTDKNVKYIVDINVLENGQVVKISDTKMKIRFALPEDLKGYKNYEIVYILNGEIKETIPAKIEDGYIVFETTHLSEYGIVATNTEENTEVTNPKTLDNVIFYIIVGVISLTGILTSYLYKKKMQN